MSNSYEANLVNKLIVDFQQGNKKLSFVKMKEFVNKNSGDETARYNLAIMCEQLNYMDMAKDQYKKILKNNSRHWKSKFNLYLIYIKEKKHEKALQQVNDVLKIKPNYQPALRDKAVILYYLQKPDEGLPFIEESLKQNQQDYIALNTLGLIYMELKQFNLAKKIFIKAIEINSKYFPTYNNLGRCYEINNDRNSALKNYKRALNLNSKFMEAINNIANCYNQSGFYKKAITYYNKALKIESENPKLIYNKALAYTYLGDYEIGEKLYKKAYSIIPDDDLLKKNYSILLLANQRFEEAWKFFEGRIGLNEFSIKNSQVNRIKTKLWKGEPINNDNKILIIKEQGAGDEILYGSMYSDLINKFSDIKIETDPRLISLFERSLNKKNIFVPYAQYSKNSEKIKKFDKILYAGSLGRLFRNKLSDFPKNNYLFVDEKKYTSISKKINQITQKIKVGISWKSKNETYGAEKSLNLDLLTTILKLDKLSFINLQYGDTKEEIQTFKRISNIEIINIEEVDLFNDFESIAALLKNLDLFISVSNTTAHLSAALGVTTWVIKPRIHAVFHYWNQPNKLSTPWYSSIRLFSHENGWEGTIQEIKKELLIKFNL